MIAFINGTVCSFTQDSVIIDNHGIGYRIYFMHPEVLTIGQEVKIYTYQHVREDEMSLFGFINNEEYEIFLKLINVKGIGPKTALNILSETSPHDFIKIVEQNDLNALKALPGIGTKAASQIILDLKGKLVNDKSVNSFNNQLIDKAILSFKALGYKQAEINNIIPELSKKDFETSEEYFKYGLQLFLKRKGF